MSKPVKVSVIMPCFNHGEFVQEAVESVTRLGRDDLELIVVDDGSTDERTRREMDALSARGINVIRQENKGLAGARNAGVLAAQGEYIFPLDADDRLRSGWLEQGTQHSGLGFESWRRLRGCAVFREPHKSLDASGRLRRRDCCAGITSMRPRCTGVLSGNRIADMTERCPSRDWRTGISGSALWSMVGSLRIFQRSFSITGKRTDQ